MQPTIPESDRLLADLPLKSVGPPGRLGASESRRVDSIGDIVRTAVRLYGAPVSEAELVTTPNLKEIHMATTPQNPFGDVTKLLEKFKVPGVDMTAIIEARRKDIEAVVESNKAAMEAMQAMARKQAEMLTAAMHEIQANVKDMASSMGDPAKQAEIAKKAYAKAVADVKDLADMARKSQTESMASITKRAQEHMEEIKKMMKPK